jgi:hypothetical protein
LRKSGDLADLEAVAQSWFEDGPEIAQAISGARGRNRAKLTTYLLQSVIARHRDKWAALFLRVALWMREAPSEFDLCWRELAIVAEALADGRGMSEIGLMRDIAQRTVAVFADDARINGRYGTSAVVAQSVGLGTREFDYLDPLLCIVSNELPELSGRA